MIRWSGPKLESLFCSTYHKSLRYGVWNCGSWQIYRMGIYWHLMCTLGLLIQLVYYAIGRKSNGTSEFFGASDMAIVNVFFAFYFVSSWEQDGTKVFQLQLTDELFETMLIEGAHMINTPGFRPSDKENRLSILASEWPRKAAVLSVERKKSQMGTGRTQKLEIMAWSAMWIFLVVPVLKCSRYHY